MQSTLMAIHHSGIWRIHKGNVHESIIRLAISNDFHFEQKGSNMYMFHIITLKKLTVIKNLKN